MEFEGGWKLDRSLRYRREPAPGYIYTFSAGESAGEVELEHYRDEPSGSSSWFTTREGWESLSRRFPKSQSGQRWSRLKHSQDGVSLDEALEIARWLTNEARSAGLLGSGEEFALPRFEQLVAIEDRIEPGEELWLCRVPRELRDEGEKFDAAFAAKGSNGEFHPLRALPRENRAFRLVVIERGKSKLHPASALGARTAVQRGKP